MNFLKPIALVCAVLLGILTGLMLAVSTFSQFIYDHSAAAFVESASITGFAALILYLIGRGQGFRLIPRQLYVLTTASWLLMSLAGALPMYYAGYGLSLTDAVFESTSGITTTGSTVLSGIESLPPSLHLWRALLQWLGGLGVIGMAVSILPFLRIGGMRLFHTESSDWSEKSLPRLQTLARMLLLTYTALTAACIVSYWLAGMTPFDATTHAMTTVSTGGYATDDRSMGRFNNQVLWVGTLFMFIGALPFTLIISFINRPSKAIIRNEQVVGLLAIVLTVTFLLATYLVIVNGMSPFEAVTHSAFNLVSIISTTGYASLDYTTWGGFAIALFFVVMFIGGCSGSTSGGMKVFRFQLSYLFLRSQIHRLVHPQGVYVPRYNQKPLADDIILSAVAFSFLFFVSLAAFTLMLAAMDLDFVTSLTASATALTNVGPGLGETIGPAGNFASLPSSAKWILSLAMIMGRLELLTVMVLVSPVFWRA